MKLATFECQGSEGWGFVVQNPADNRMWIYEPGKVDRQLQLSASATNGFAVSMPRFMPDSQWPDELATFLALEDDGMRVLERMQAFLLRFLEQCDEARMTYCGHPVDEVMLKAPIPRPRLMWGLVQNCPTFIRSNPDRRIANFFPQGHQRSQGSVAGSGQLFYQPPDTGQISFNVELGIVIGKKGRYIPVTQAMEYVAGYTVVIDSQVNGYYPLMDPEGAQGYDIGMKYDWYVGATCSWCGKMADAHCVVGPWIVTPEEVGNPYDLLVYTRMSGRNRDRSHTAALLVGIERTIQWYSSFATLYPGDIIHLGTMGTDGLGTTEEMHFNGLDATVESEIERVGEIKSPVLNMDYGDWRGDDDVTKTLHVSSAARDLILAGKDRIDGPGDWTPAAAPHFWTVYKNYDTVDAEEGLAVLPTPRFLNGPNSSLGVDRSQIEIPHRATGLDIGIELAFVVSRLAKAVRAGDASDYILGYMPLISVSDRSFDDVLVEPTTRQERGIPAVYGRWADGFNTVPIHPVQMTWEEVSDRTMSLTVEGIGTAQGSTGEYVAGAPQALSFMTTYITFFPGDVVTLGCVRRRVFVSAGQVCDGMHISGGIEGIGTISVTLKKSNARVEENTYYKLNL